MAEVKYIPIEGGINQENRSLSTPTNYLLSGVNVEQKTENGMRRTLGYTKVDSTVVPGGGQIRGVAFYNDKYLAFRDDAATSPTACVMYESSGSGWTSKKTGLTPSGRYEAVVENFDGTSKIYFASGVHKAAQWDGTTWTDITTGVGSDAPSYVEARRKRLYLAEGSILVFSDVSTPTAFVGYGALSGSLAMPETINGIMTLPGGALGCWSANNISIISGDTYATITQEDLGEHKKFAGALPYSVQMVSGIPTFLHSNGVMTLPTTDAFGDFENATISNLIRTTLTGAVNQLTATCVIPSKNQYRLFFDTGAGIIMTFSENRLKGSTFLSWPDIVRCTFTSQNTSGEEIAIFGSDDGFVYKMEDGNAFDDEPIVATMTTAYANMGHMRREKTFRRAIFDMKVSGSATVNAEPLFKFGEPPAQTEQEISIAYSASLLGYGKLGTFVLGSTGSRIQEGRLDMPGKGDYVAMKMSSSSSTDDPWEIDAIQYEYLLGKMRR